MIRHIVLWKYKEELDADERARLGAEAKQRLEALKEKIPGIIHLKVTTSTLPTGSGNCDFLLDSAFVNTEALEFYQKHEEHVKAGAFVGSISTGRICVDYEE